MYAVLLTSHSIIRWIVLLLIIIGFIAGLSGKNGSKAFGKKENLIRALSVIFFHVQATIGLVLYFISPVIKFFMSDTPTAMKDSNVRFFGIEHIIIMILAVILLTIGSVKIKKAVTDKEKYSKMALFFGITLLLICIAIPWPFSPYVSRPWLSF